MYSIDGYETRSSYKATAANPACKLKLTYLPQHRHPRWRSASGDTFLDRKYEDLHLCAMQEMHAGFSHISGLQVSMASLQRDRDRASTAGGRPYAPGAQRLIKREKLNEKRLTEVVLRSMVLRTLDNAPVQVFKNYNLHMPVDHALTMVSAAQACGPAGPSRERLQLTHELCVSERLCVCLPAFLPGARHRI